MVNPKIKEYMIQTAKDNNINYQIEVIDLASKSTEAHQLTRAGIPCGVISIPTRYPYTPYEIISKIDVMASVDLLTKLFTLPYLYSPNFL